MKKMMMLAAVMAIVGSGFATDVYDVSIVVQEPIVRSNSQGSYTDFANVEYRGYMNLDVMEDGTISNGCNIVVYRKAGNNIWRGKTMPYSFVSFNACGVNEQKSESCIECSGISTTYQLMGLGTSKTKIAATSNCGESTPAVYIPQFLSGNVNGFIENAGGPCGEIGRSCTFGKYAIRRNETLTKYANKYGFDSLVATRFPKNVIWE